MKRRGWPTAGGIVMRAAEERPNEERQEEQAQHGQAVRPIQPKTVGFGLDEQRVGHSLDYMRRAYPDIPDKADTSRQFRAISVK